jgi:tetratricopeptide (TPR) repeat protein
MKTSMTTLSLVTMALLSPSIALANSTPLVQIQSEWAQCQYTGKNNDEKIDCLEQTIIHNSNELKAAPENPELTVWLAINKATLAGEKGGLGALSLAKEAKNLLEKVIDTAPQTLDGSAFTSLGSLYYKVPGWPIGFGDDDKAEQLLKQAIAINPKGIDPNYFYADFLIEEGRRHEAMVYLNRAQNALPRPDRPLADKGRHQEIDALLARLK